MDMCTRYLRRQRDRSMRLLCLAKKAAALGGRWTPLLVLGVVAHLSCANVDDTTTSSSRSKAATYLQPRTDSLCAYDRLRVRWQLNLAELTQVAEDSWQPPLLFDLYRDQEVTEDEQEGSQELLTSFDVIEEGGGQNMPAELATSRPTVPELDSCSFTNPITCLLNGPTCTPNVESMQLDSSNRRFTLNLDQATNQPALPTLSSFLAVLDLDRDLASALAAVRPQDDGSDGTHSSSAQEVVTEERFRLRWVTAQSLETHLPSWAFNVMYGAASTGQLSLKLRPRDCRDEIFSGNLTLRLSMPGRYRLVLSYATANGTRRSWGPTSSSWSVHACGDTLVQVAPSPQKTDPAKLAVGHTVTSRVPEPVLWSASVLSFTSQRPLRIAHTTLPNQEVGSWSMGFWVMLLDGPTGHHRTLFYKGNGDADRTPSAWLLPNSNRLTLRASVEGSSDLGSDSVSEVAVGEWAHVLLIFANDTQSLEDSAKGEPGILYATSLFLNGRHDVTVKYKVPALANQGPLSIGKDPSHRGPRMLVSHLKVWDRALTRVQARLEYEKTATLYAEEEKNATDGKAKWRSGSSGISRSAQAINAAMASGLGPFKRAAMSTAEGCGTQVHEGPSPGELLVDSPQVMFEAAEEARKSCSHIAERVSLFEAAASKGHAQAAFNSAMLRLFGQEELTYDYRLPDKDCRPTNEQMAEVRSTRRAWQDLAMASSMGHAPATRLLAMSLVSGIGVGAKGWWEQNQGHSEAMSVSGARPGFKADVGNAALEVVALQQPDGGLAMSTKATSVALGLMHLAAVLDDPQAQRVLAVRYQNGWGVEKDVIASAFYYEGSGEVASAHYHTPGHEPHHEMQRLSDATVEKVEVGQRGEDDEDLRYTTMRAEEGNVAAMITMGDLLYWGARGMPRDHTRALRYFERAAEAGDRGAMCLAAGMYLKGEGGTMNHTRAVELYNEAADGGSVRALNGLGYAYYVGDAVEKNLTMAFTYFERAAAMESDGDSLFNAGFLLEHGMGTTKDLVRAASYYRMAAEKFGHFDSAHVLGKLYMDGRAVGQNWPLACRYLEPSSRMGHWGRLVRGGFDRYLARDYLGAYLMYSQASELGYETARINAAFLLDRHLVDPLDLIDATTTTAVVTGSNVTGRGEGALVVGAGGAGGDESQMRRRAREALSLRLHWLSFAQGSVAESALPIGDAYYYAYAGLPQDYQMAAYWYSKASAAGVPQGSLYLGFMYEMGLGVGHADWDRAEKHYRRALQLDTSEANWVVCMIALSRLSVWRVLDRLRVGRGLIRRLSQGSAYPSRSSRPPANTREQRQGGAMVLVQLLARGRAMLRSPDLDWVVILVLSVLLVFVLLWRTRLRRRRPVTHKRVTEQQSSHDATPEASPQSTH